MVVRCTLINGNIELRCTRDGSQLERDFLKFIGSQFDREMLTLSKGDDGSLILKKFPKACCDRGYGEES
jgi:hypothetical protein